MAPHIAIHEGGLEVEIDKRDFGQPVTEGGETFTDVNPKGYVPALRMDDGSVLTECVAILQYLAEKSGNGLSPTYGSLERHRHQEWLTYITTELHKGIVPLLNPTIGAVEQANVSDLLTNRIEFIDAHLSENNYLMGDGFTVADGYAFSVLGWTKMAQFDLSGFPNVRAYLDRVGARPAVQKTMRAEGLLESA